MKISLIHENVVMILLISRLLTYHAHKINASIDKFPNHIPGLLGFIIKGMPDLVHAILDNNNTKSFELSKLISSIEQVRDDFRSYNVQATTDILKNHNITMSIISAMKKSMTKLEECNNNDCYSYLVQDKGGEQKKKLIASIADLTDDYRKELNQLTEQCVICNMLVDQPKKPSILNFIIKLLIDKYTKQVENNTYCGSTMSMRTTIAQVSTFMLNVIVKSYTMILLAHAKRYNTYQEEHNSREAERQKVHMQVMIKIMFADYNIILATILQALDSVSRDIRPCDPAVYEKGVNYEKLTNLIYPTLLSRKKKESLPVSTGDCDTERDFNMTELYWRHPEYISCNEDFNDVQKAIYVIEGKTPRYIAYLGINLRLGFPTPTPIYYKIGREDFLQNSSEILKLGNTNPILYSETLCKPLMCWLDDIFNADSVRQISLDLVQTSSINHVVTGIRWVIRDKTLILEIQEGRRTENNSFLVIPSTVTWQQRSPLVHVAKLTHSYRSFGLDDVVLRPGIFVTGVSFFDDNGVITLRVYGRGKYQSTRSPMITSSMVKGNNREEITLNAPEIPEQTPHDTQHRVWGTPNRSYIKFRPSDFNKDLGQTTVPYFDIQPIVTNPPSPIGGIGTYYKGMNGFGGFLGLKIISFDELYVSDHELIRSQYQNMSDLIWIKNSQLWTH